QPALRSGFCTSAVARASARSQTNRDTSRSTCCVATCAIPMRSRTTREQVSLPCADPHAARYNHRPVPFDTTKLRQPNVTVLPPTGAPEGGRTDPAGDQHRDRAAASSTPTAARHGHRCLGYRAIAARLAGACAATLRALAGDRWLA